MSAFYRMINGQLAFQQDNKVQKLLATVGSDSAIHAIADDFDSSKIYEIGDYVISNGKLYRVTAPVHGIRPPDPEHYAETTIADELSQINFELEGFNLHTYKGNMTFDANGRGEVVVPGIIVNEAYISAQVAGNTRIPTVQAFANGKLVLYAWDLLNNREIKSETHAVEVIMFYK